MRDILFLRKAASLLRALGEETGDLGTVPVGVRTLRIQLSSGFSNGLSGRYCATGVFAENWPDHSR